MPADPVTPVPRNPKNKVTVYGPDSVGGSCDDGHAKVEMYYPDECAECRGSDAYGSPFCPVCQFCCGC